jgi:hypothetical protein
MRETEATTGTLRKAVRVRKTNHAGSRTASRWLDGEGASAAARIATRHRTTIHLFEEVATSSQ